MNYIDIYLTNEKLTDEIQQKTFTKYIEIMPKTLPVTRICRK